MTAYDIMDFIDVYNQKLTIFGALLSAAAAVIATFAAVYSAKIARSALSATEQADRQFNIRTTLMDAHAIKISCDHMKHLSTELKLNYQSLAVFHGVSGGSRDEMYQQSAFEKYDHAVELATDANDLIAQPHSLDGIGEQQLHQTKNRMSTTLLEITALRERMIDELSEIRLRNSEARNVRLSQQLNQAR